MKGDIPLRVTNAPPGKAEFKKATAFVLCEFRVTTPDGKESTWINFTGMGMLSSGLGPAEFKEFKIKAGKYRFKARLCAKATGTGTIPAAEVWTEADVEVRGPTNLVVVASVTPTKERLPKPVLQSLAGYEMREMTAGVWTRNQLCHDDNFGRERCQDFDLE